MKTATETIAAADDQLNRAIGLSGATMLVLGSVIGSGIFLTTGIMMSQLPSTTLVLVAWVAACWRWRAACRTRRWARCIRGPAACMSF